MAKKLGKIKVSKKFSFLKKEKNKRIMIGVLAGVVLVLLLFNFKDWLIVAVVGKKPITRYQYNQDLEKQCGAQVLETLVLKNLILLLLKTAY